MKKKLTIALLALCTLAPLMGMNYVKKVYGYLFSTTTNAVETTPKKELSPAEKLDLLQEKQKALDEINVDSFTRDEFYKEHLSSLHDLCWAYNITYTTEATDARTFKTNLAQLVELCEKNAQKYNKLITTLLRLLEEEQK